MTMNSDVIGKLYDALGIELNAERIINDFLIKGFLTENVGRDNRKYIHYFDGSLEGCIDEETLSVITDKEKLDELFY